MTTTSGYKLEALLQHREATKQRRQERLARARLAERQSRAKEEEARTARDKQRAVLRRLRDDGRTAAQRTTAAELAARQSFIARTQAELEGLERALTSARQAVADAMADTTRAKELLAAAIFELEAVQQHKQRWLRKRQIAREREAEAELDDLVAAREPKK